MHGSYMNELFGMQESFSDSKKTTSDLIGEIEVSYYWSPQLVLGSGNN